MSFKRSGIVIGGRAPPTGVPGGNPVTGAVSGRAPVPARGPVPSRGPIPQRGAPVPSRGPINDVTDSVHTLSLDEEIKHPGVRPSTLTSQPTVSTGSADLDKILGHQGLPLGNSILIEESGTTDFASVLLKVFASQGVMHNRLDAKVSNTHIIVVSLNTAWSKELPGVYKGSSRDLKKHRVIENEKKISVQNLIDSNVRGQKKPRVEEKKKSDSDLKIAWRYGLNDRKQNTVNIDNEIYKDFNNQFDITSRLSPSPAQNELTFIPSNISFKQLIKHIETTIQQHNQKIVRLIIPSILNPSMYPQQAAQPQEILQFVHTLRALLRKHKNLVIASTISLDLYPKDTSLMMNLEKLFDAVIHLEPFNQDMLKFLEKAYSNQPTKVQHGLVHIHKIPNLSERGQMLVMKSEFAFKNGKKKFEIEEWGIPVEDEGEPQQTTQNIEF